MLGFGAISSRSISGSPYKLVGYAAAMAAAGTIAFSGSAQWGAYQRISATGSMVFGGSAIWSSRNALGSTGALTFGGNANLRVAGRPIVFYAVPERLEFVGIPERYDFTAKPDNFTFRGN